MNGKDRDLASEIARIYPLVFWLLFMGIMGALVWTFPSLQW